VKGGTSTLILIGMVSLSVNNTERKQVQCIPTSNIYSLVSISGGDHILVDELP
jgi:hypothetical protein